MDVETAKQKLDHVIHRSRVHLYKPIQVAEILYHHRIGSPRFDIAQVEEYRNRSKDWRDEVTNLLVGNVSTSSQKFQDNLFEPNAVPPAAIQALDQVNLRTGGAVEAYIYYSFKEIMKLLHDLYEILLEATPQSFDLSKFITTFEGQQGLKRSIDKIYEIAVYALFNTLVDVLDARVTLSISKEKTDIVKEFEDFAWLMFGLRGDNQTYSAKAALFRAGVANAADTGVDIWTNFGPTVQVKHISLKPEDVEEISEKAVSDSLIIVCKDADRAVIEAISKQLGLVKIRGVVVQKQLEGWYSKALRGKHSPLLAEKLLKQFTVEFGQEFPSSKTLGSFLKERGYDKIKRDGWYRSSTVRLDTL